MERDPSQTLYTVALTGVRDPSSQKKLAETLSSVSGRLPMEAVMQRLNTLPWTLTRKASYKRAYRLAKLLESLGGEIECVPPLPKAAKPLMDETQILYGAGLLSQTQVMSATQFLASPEESPSPVASPSIPDYREQRASFKAPEPRQPSPVHELEQKPVHVPPPKAKDADENKSLVKKYVWTVLLGLLVVASAVGSVMLIVILLFIFGWIS